MCPQCGLITEGHPLLAQTGTPKECCTMASVSLAKEGASVGVPGPHPKPQQGGGQPQSCGSLSASGVPLAAAPGHRTPSEGLPCPGAQCGK